MSKRFDIPYIIRSLRSLDTIELMDPNGRGSVGTAIRRFLTIVRNVGTSMTLTQSSTNGDSVTINAEGLYAINYSDSFVGAASDTIGISKNASSLSTIFTGITDTGKLALAVTPSAGLATTCSWVGKLVPGDIIRGHTGTTSGGDTTAHCTRFSIVRIK